MISDIADAGLGFSGFLARPGDRARLHDEQLAVAVASERPLDVLVRAEVPLDALADLDQLRER